jgi:hypothetical protein
MQNKLYYLHHSMLSDSWNFRLKILNCNFVKTGRDILFQILHCIECCCLMFKQDKVQFTAESYILFCVCVACVISSNGRRGSRGRRRSMRRNVGRSCFAAGFTFLEIITNLTQNSHFKQCIFLGLWNLQPHPIYCITVPLVDMNYTMCVGVRVCVIYM